MWGRPPSHSQGLSPVQDRQRPKDPSTRPADLPVRPAETAGRMLSYHRRPGETPPPTGTTRPGFQTKGHRHPTATSPTPATDIRGQTAVSHGPPARTRRTLKCGTFLPATYSPTDTTQTRLSSPWGSNEPESWTYQESPVVLAQRHHLQGPPTSTTPTGGPHVGGQPPPVPLFPRRGGTTEATPTRPFRAAANGGAGGAHHRPPKPGRGRPPIPRGGGHHGRCTTPFGDGRGRQPTPNGRADGLQLRNNLGPEDLPGRSTPTPRPQGVHYQVTPTTRTTAVRPRGDRTVVHRPDSSHPASTTHVTHTRNVTTKL